MATRLEIFGKAFAAGLPNGASGVACPSLTGSAAAFAAATLSRRIVLAVTAGLPQADTLFADLETIADEAGIRVMEFPPSLEDDRASTAARLRVSAALGAYALRPYQLVIVAPIMALRERMSAAKAAQAAVVRLGKDSPISFADLQKHLLAAGYERVAEVTAVGEFSVRGGVVDAWSPNAEMPIRAEFFGDDLEELRKFNPATQTSVGKIEAADFEPVELSTLGKETLIFEALPDDSTILWLEHNDYRGEIETFADSAKRFRAIFTGDPAPRGMATSNFITSPLPGFAETTGTDFDDRIKVGLKNHLAAAKKNGALISQDDNLSAGFECDGLVVVTKSDRIPGVKGRRPIRNSRLRSGERLTEAMDIEPGELVVHLDYGIGKFLGSTEVEVGDSRSEVFTIEYADGAKLHVPVTHAHLLSRYVGVKGEHVKLHRLDGKRWTKEKLDAKKSVEDLAASLLETQARRAVVPGFACNVTGDDIDAFEAAFPYEETPDQARAIEDVKRDLSVKRPMDRLICGDAGYGKTEVAMRAAFIAAMNGRQTVLLAPTTVLAQQHYETFLARFDGTPIRIEALSRFQSNESKTGTRSRLQSGAADIVIGTHALLSHRVQFRNLGLIIVDEEQRFGVKHKEYLKRLRTTADVLTMSATPIPRTLYLSLTGTRDLSVLKTPPRERVAVETKVVRDDDIIVKTAIERELARGGQVYFLYNRVMTISKEETRLRKLCPDAKIDVAHGQMPTPMLAEKMRKFAEGKTDILLCTTIVEAGLDIQRANTILVDRADRFGIAELYQLRGRVGRGARQGYAYFLLPEEGLVDSDARERLDALRKHTGHGSGFNLSMRDLEIRGAGNLLGSEQSGHIAAVGFTLYCQLLQRTIAKLRGEKVPDLVDVQLNLDFVDFSPGTANPEDAAALPYDYVEDESQRMDFHKRLAQTAELADVTRLKRELADRYGKLPPPAKRLVKLAEFRVMCSAKGVARLDATDGRAIFYNAAGSVIGRFRFEIGASTDAKISALVKMLGRIGGEDK